MIDHTRDKFTRNRNDDARNVGPDTTSQYYAGLGVRVRYLHSKVEVLERTAILADLRRGTFDVLVGINLLREGLDLPEVSLVAILDADKEGFLRSATSLVQTIGRTARNVNGTVILYADRMTDSLTKAIGEFEKQMKAAAKRLEFEEAAQIRDRIKELRAQQIYKT